MGVPFLTYLPYILQGLPMIAQLIQGITGGGQTPTTPYNPWGGVGGGMPVMNEQMLITMFEGEAKQAREMAKNMEAYADQLDSLIKKLKED